MTRGRRLGEVNVRAADERNLPTSTRKRPFDTTDDRRSRAPFRWPEGIAPIAVGRGHGEVAGARTGG
jgi:hypothetical protein